MRSENLTTEQVLNVFTEEVAARGGRVSDTFNDGRRLFARSILPSLEEGRPGDRLQGGVAIKATEEEISLYPYIFRLVCRNGAITAEAIGATIIEDLRLLDPHTTIQSIREGIEICLAREVFSENVQKMRKTTQSEADLVLNLLPFFSRNSPLASTDVLRRIMDRFFAEKDQSQFALANAVTSVARDTRDPETRWNLEELGGGLLIAAPTRLPRDGARAAGVKRIDRPRRKAVSVA